MKQLLALLLLGFALSAQAAASYSIDWFTIDGGGGTSSGGNYSLSGTIGQPDAGRMTGGSYAIDGGFWGGAVSFFVPAAPLLRIFLTTTNTAIVAWPSAAVGFHLQQNGNLSTTVWTTVVNPVNVVGSENQVTISPPVGNEFYRLKNP